MLYRDRALEELKAIVEQYRLNYKSLFGKELPDSEVEELTAILIKERKEQLFRGVFQNLSAENLLQAEKLFLNFNQLGFDSFVKEIGEAELEANAKLMMQDVEHIDRTKDVSEIHIKPKKARNRPLREKT